MLRDTKTLQTDPCLEFLDSSEIMGPSAVDYSLYLVTDSTPEILGKRDLVEVVRAALDGGVTVV